MAYIYSDIYKSTIRSLLDIASTYGLVLLLCIEKFLIRFKEKSSMLTALTWHLSFSERRNVASPCFFNKYFQGNFYSESPCIDDTNSGLVIEWQLGLIKFQVKLYMKP